ncbi:MAG: penicillin-binding protein 2 [Elusimicrobiota bacterium]
MSDYDKKVEALDNIYKFFYIIVAFFAVRLINIQIINHSYYLELSERNRIRVISKLGPRGNIISSDGVLLAHNKPSYSVMFFPRENITSKYIDDISKRISKLLNVRYEHIDKNIQMAQKTLKPIKIVDNLSINRTMFFYEIKNIFPEIEIIEENLRDYPYGNLLSHVIGYTGKIDNADLKYYLSKNYPLDAIVGKTGVEKKYEDYLKGKNGGLFMEVDNKGRVIRIMGFEKWEKGNDVILTINYKVQKAAEDALSKLPYKRGSAVCLESESGKVLAYAVKPGYDLNYFTSYRDEKKIDEIDEFNIPISGLYPPASTFKIISAIAAIESGKLNENSKFYCPGYYDAGNRIFKCWKKEGHKNLDMIDALAHSCDVYFYNVGYTVGPYEIEKIAKKMRLNEKSQIDLPFEKAGKIFGPRSRMESKGYWFIGDTLNMAIGQGEALVTPMGMAMFMMALANHGTFYLPYYVDRIVSPEGKVIVKNFPGVISKVSLKDKTYDVIYKALRKVVSEGTGKLSAVKGVDVYGKTGTAQNPHGKDHAWFVSFAKKNGMPSIAISVFIEHGEHGSTAAAPIAREIIKAYFNEDSTLKEKEEKDVIIE